ncbi:hypothetical protein HK104_009952 [Borealophlyctis nickersoniae]|nr:hypothetical protein HK104_009952 [Borealophlyctis nickersoniae]
MGLDQKHGADTCGAAMMDEIVGAMMQSPEINVSHLLVSAVRARSIATLGLLIAHGAKPNESDQTLWEVVLHGHKDMVQLLLNHRRDPRRLLSAALNASSDRSAIRRLLDAGAFPDVNRYNSVK